MDGVMNIVIIVDDFYVKFCEEHIVNFITLEIKNFTTIDDLSIFRKELTNFIKRTVELIN